MASNWAPAFPPAHLIWGWTAPSRRSSRVHQRVSWSRCFHRCCFSAGVWLGPHSSLGLSCPSSRWPLKEEKTWMSFCEGRRPGFLVLYKKINKNGLNVLNRVQEYKVCKIIKFVLALFLNKSFFCLVFPKMCRFFYHKWWKRDISFCSEILDSRWIKNWSNRNFKKISTWSSSFKCSICRMFLFYSKKLTEQEPDQTCTYGETKRYVCLFIKNLIC